MIDHPDLLPRAKLVQAVPAPRGGYVAGVDAAEIGLTSVELGGGRAKKGDSIDHAVGVIVHRKVGDSMQAGEPLFTIHANDKMKLASAGKRLLAAVEWSDLPVEPLPLSYGVVE
jgi:pyrimidine-nucleoside phosphorylase